MLSHQEFVDWARALDLAPAAVATLTQVRTSNPIRRVSNVGGNMCGAFASRKMGCTIQWESLTNERAAVLLWEADASCLEFWDQSLRVKIKYKSKSGKSTGVWTTVDYVVLRKDWAGVVDLKASHELNRLVLEQPERWTKTGAQLWDQPPVRESLNQIGLGYQVLTEHDIPSTLVRNIDFLRSRLLRRTNDAPNEIAKLRETLAVAKRMSIANAISLVGDADLIFQGHFEGRWFLALADEPLALADDTSVYESASAYAFFRALVSCQTRALAPACDPNDLAIGSYLLWGDSPYRLLARTQREIALQAPDNSIVQITRTKFRDLVASEDMRVQRDQHNDSVSLEFLRKASDEDLKTANSILETLTRYWSGTAIAQLGVPRRTLYEWRARYRDAELQLGNGYLGLIAQSHRKGNRTPRTSSAELEQLNAAFAWLKTPPAKEVKVGFNYYIHLCETHCTQARSFVAFSKAWEKRDTYLGTKAREGERAAYPEKAPRVDGGNHLSQGPPEGDSPFAKVHVDHLQSDVFCRRMNRLEVLQKPWITLAIDAYTRLVLAIWISLLAPSHMAVLMVLREIVRRHGRLPMMTITDGGSDFKSALVGKFLASKGAEHALRPRGEPRFGNPVERLNLDINHHLTTVVHGSNSILKKPRMSSRSHDPRALAYMTVPMFAQKVEALVFDEYPDKFHNGLHATPRQTMQSAAILQGQSWGVPARFDEALVFQTLARLHKHGGLVRQRDGIRANGHNYYSEALIGRDHQRLADVPMYDPEDPTYIMARLGKEWIKCQMIDSQRRRLPPPDQRRYYLSERIFLSRPSYSEAIAKQHASSLGRMYADIERERVDQSYDNDLPNEAGIEPASFSPITPELVDHPLPELKPSPISRRKRST